MGKFLGIALKLLKIWITISPFLAVVYLVTWLIQIFNQNLFTDLDAIFGPLPLFMDSLIYVPVDMNGTEITMGYVYSAGATILSCGIALQIEKKLDKLKRLKDNQALEKKAIKIEQKIEKKEEKEKEKEEKILKKIDFYCGLFELNLEYYNPVNKTLEDLDKLKKEYTKMISAKLKEKYTTLKFVESDRIFIYSNKFEHFDELINDIYKLYKIFYDLDYEKLIKTDLLLSFWCGIKKPDAKTAYKIVSQINNLKFLNKIIVADKFAQRYREEKIQMFELVPLGPSRLDIKDHNGDDWEMELFHLKKLD